MIKDNRRFTPLVLFFIALLLTTLSVLLLILPQSTFSFIPVSPELISGIILLLLTIGAFVLPFGGIVLGILVIFRFKSPILALFEIALNLAIPVLVLSFEMF